LLDVTPMTVAKYTDEISKNRATAICLSVFKKRIIAGPGFVRIQPIVYRGPRCRAYRSPVDSPRI
jgi:hypothetical protein